MMPCLTAHTLPGAWKIPSDPEAGLHYGELSRRVLLPEETLSSGTIVTAPACSDQFNSNAVAIDDITFSKHSLGGDERTAKYKLMRERYSIAVRYGAFLAIELFGLAIILWDGLPIYRHLFVFEKVLTPLDQSVMWWAVYPDSDQLLAQRPSRATIRASAKRLRRPHHPVFKPSQLCVRQLIVRSGGLSKSGC